MSLPFFCVDTRYHCSIHDDGTLHIQTIVAYLLKLVQTVTTTTIHSPPSGKRSTSASGQRFNKDEGNDLVLVDDNDRPIDDAYNNWLHDLAEKIFRIWSTKLGRGPKGSDAYEDAHAWLSLSRTIRHLTVSRMMTTMMMSTNQPSSPSSSLSMNNDLEMALSRYVVRRALDGTGNWKQQLSDGTIDEDWVSLALNQTLNRWIVPSSESSRHDDAWQILAFVSVVLSELGGENFPQDDPAKCLAMVEIAATGFYIGLKEVHAKVLLRCHEEQKEKRKEPDDGLKLDMNEGTTSSSTTKTTTASQGETDVANHNWEKAAMFAFLQQVEASCHDVSVLTRRLCMNNACFPRASLIVECIRGFARHQKTPFLGAKPVSPRQSKLDLFLSRETPATNPVVGN
jgi:hypothetical protein